MTINELLPILLEDKDFFDTSGDGVTLSGGECLCQAEEIEVRIPYVPAYNDNQMNKIADFLIRKYGELNK